MDLGTGKNALDIIKKDRVCGKCRYDARGDGVTMFKEDIVCVNADSRYLSESVFENDTCEFWESEEKK